MDSASLHARAYVADGHADSLMWNRDLLTCSKSGHVDVPRLKEAGVDLQCFTVVTRGYPWVNGFDAFCRYRGWPLHARRSDWARCTWQLDRMAEFCRESKGAMSLTTRRDDLDRNFDAGTLSAVLGIEGGHCLEGQVDRVAELVRRGVTFMGLTHLSNNDLGGSSFPLMGDKPLTPKGHEVLEAMASAGMAVDVAHASRASLSDMLAHPKVRLLSSHTGVEGAHRSWRNLPDDALATIAARGGVVGIIFAPTYLGGRGYDAEVRHIEHAVRVMGEDSVGFGSDFDGMVPLPRGMHDVRDLPKLTDVLLSRGLSTGQVEKIAGGNFRRFFGELLPSQSISGVSAA